MNQDHPDFKQKGWLNR